MIIFLYFLVVNIFTIPSAEIKSSHFEGVLTYSLHYTPDTNFPSFTNERIQEIQGATLKIIFKKGFQKKLFYSPDGALLTERYLDLKASKSYSHSINSDTIYWVDITSNDSPTQFEYVQDTIVAGYTCRQVNTQTSTYMDRYPGKVFRSSGTYFYSKELSFNPRWFNNYQEGNFKDIAKIAKGIAVESHYKGQFWTSVSRLEKVEKRKITPQELCINFPADGIYLEL